MKRLYEPAAYGPQGACFWADTVEPPDWPSLTRDSHTDVAVIGGGFTGLSAALHLAEAGIETTLLEAEHPGYGASGRNGGLCCAGGAMADARVLTRRFGPQAAKDWHHTERAAVETVEDLITRYSIEVDRHSDGETRLAHTPRAWAAMQAEAKTIPDSYGTTATLIPKDALRQHGMAGPWHGAMTLPIGFGLNPRKYHSGLSRAARMAGAALHAHSPVQALTRAQDGWLLRTPHASLRAKRVILATNGYSSEDLPRWLRARTLPVQSSVIVTRPLTAEEQTAQGWTSAQMAYDSRSLLHYFRLMPDGRFLFGMRGGLRATPAAQTRISARIRADFTRLFPAWKHVEIPYEWAGLVCLMANLAPFVGPVPDHPGLFAGLGYHGNGVAMASHSGRILADLLSGKTPSDYPEPMRQPPARFPFGRFRRMLLGPAYLAAELFDL